MSKCSIFFLIVSLGYSLANISCAYAEDNWSARYTLPNYAQKSVQLLQADMIKKADSDYYDNVGKTYIGEVNTQYHIGVMNTYNQEGNFNNLSELTNSTVDISGALSKTSSIGSLNNSSTSITNSGQGVIDVSNYTESTGNQNANIDRQ